MGAEREGGEDKGRKGEKETLREKDHGVGGQGDDGRSRREERRRGVGGWEQMHTRQLGRKTETGLRPARGDRDGEEELGGTGYE